MTWGLLLATCLAAFGIYSAGFNAPWTFDDPQNLGGLSEVRDLQSAIDFVFRKNAVGGPGRPLALATFLANVRDWPDQPEGFRRLNVLIHILNGLLVAVVASQSARFVPRLAQSATPFGVTLSAIWMLHPLLASASLLAVQRMTVLAGTFSLMGLAAYLRGRAQLQLRPLAAYLWMSGGLALGSLIGLLVKEIAALLPLLAGVLEWSVISAYCPTKQRLWLAWRTIFFGGAAAALIAYVVWAWKGVLAGYELRTFGVEQRILSEAVILFAYARQILLPDVTLIGPFQDDTNRVLGPDSFLAWSACGAWLLLLVAAVFARRRYPPFSFAVLFYLTGHLLESTIFPLELYFEHRNYIPSLGPIGGAVGLAWAANFPWLQRIIAAVPVVAGVLLWYTTNLWGQPGKAALAWATAHPTSVRATQNLAVYYFSQGNYPALSAFLDGAHQSQPDQPDLALQSLMAKCYLGDRNGFNRLASEVVRKAAGFAVDKNALLNLSNLAQLYEKGQCPAADAAQLDQLIRAFLANPRFSRDPKFSNHLFLALAQLHLLSGERGKGMDALWRAFDLLPSADVGEALLTLLIKYGDTESARDFLNQAAQHLSAPQFDKGKWLNRINAASKLHSQEEAGPPN